MKGAAERKTICPFRSDNPQTDIFHFPSLLLSWKFARKRRKGSKSDFRLTPRGLLSTNFSHSANFPPVLRLPLVFGPNNFAWNIGTHTNTHGQSSKVHWCIIKYRNLLAPFFSPCGGFGMWIIWWRAGLFSFTGTHTLTHTHTYTVGCWLVVLDR